MEQTDDIAKQLLEISETFLGRREIVMIFDNYRVTAEALTVPPAPQAHVQIVRRYSDGWVLLQVSGPDGSRWSLDASTNFTNWTALKTNTITGSSFEYTDMTAPPFARRFYRARLVP